MKMKRMLLSGIVVLVLLLGGCYMDIAGDEVDTSTITLDFSSQAALGDFGPGYYIVAHAYPAEDVAAMFADGTIYYDGWYYYAQDELLTPAETQAFFLGNQPPPFGVVVIIGLAPKKYRFVLELHNYYPGDSTIDSASITGILDVKAGENATLQDIASLSTYENYRYSYY